MAKHPWHEIQIGKDQPEIVNAIIEIPKGSRAKYEIDKDSGLIKLDRVLHGSMMYPVHYGIIPQTLFDDGDPLDVLVLTQVSLVPLTLVSAKVIGAMRMIDHGVTDDKIIAVANTDPSVLAMNDVNDIPEMFITELKNFFENYTKLEGKNVQVSEFIDKKSAYSIIQYSIDLYSKTY